MHDIFISYRQDGSRGWAAYLHDFLQRRFGPNKVFLDNEDLRIGDWEQQLNAALGQCRVFVLIIGPQWLQAKRDDGQPRLLDPTDVHRWEIEAALASERVTVIPVLVDGARMPAQRDLPESIAQLALRQALELAVPLDPGVLHPRSFAKYAVAFPGMSRSIFTRASSARSRAISICSGLTGFVPAPISRPSLSALIQL